MIMTTDVNIKQQIYQLIELIPVERLPTVQRFLVWLLQPTKTPPRLSTAPIYQVHQYAVDTGIPDLAEHHDHYLYGVSQDNE
jgi:hypothetical protein